MARQSAIASALAAAQEKALWEKAQSAAAALQAADDVRDRGDIRTAVRLYAHLARSKPTNDYTTAARERLGGLADEARAKLAEIDKSLTDVQFSAADMSTPRPSDEAQWHMAAWEKTVRAAFDDYHEIVERYRDVPSVGSQLTGHVNRQRHRPELAMILNEPEAKTLLEAGRQHEAEGHPCCAYWVYRQASQLAPAPSAYKAQARFEELQKVPNILALAEACREMQQCHKLYARGERILPLDPQRARELFAEVARRTPADSEIHRAAQRQLDATVQ
jgi:hypothetical protein